MLTPNGQLANRMEKVMLLSLWANALKKEHQNKPDAHKKMILAGLGKPTYPINSNTVKSYLNYWKNLENLGQQWHLNPESIEENTAIDYGDPRGDTEATTLMARCMSNWYQSDIQPDNVLFTVGGIAALRMVFETFNTLFPKGYRVITPFPHYSAYANNPMHILHPIDVMSEPGYKLTAHALEKSIQQAYALAEKDGVHPKAVLICNPSNPLGNIIDETEIGKIPKVLRNHPDLTIIFDEAYAEMCFVPMPSFLKIAPDLKKRTIIMRSATKALSAAGERMAILIAFDEMLINEILHQTITSFIHAPRSAQMAYAQTMACFDKESQNKLCKFYQKKVKYVVKRLESMGVALPDAQHQVEATFYAIGDFSDLLGMELPEEAARALQKHGKVETGEELAYYLLFTESIMLAPLSYFGLPQKNTYLRITCSGNQQELQTLMDRLEQRLLIARQSKKFALLSSIMPKLSELKTVDSTLYQSLSSKITTLRDAPDDCFSLKETNHILNNIKTTTTAHLQDQIFSETKSAC